MVWCNQLVVLLASLLQSLTQPVLLALHSQGKAQPKVMQYMRAATQPNIAPTLHLINATRNSAPDTQLSIATPRECELGKLGKQDSVMTGQSVMDIGPSSFINCSSRFVPTTPKVSCCYWTLDIMVELVCFSSDPILP